MERLGCPRDVSWEIVVPHEEQAHRNHGQSLARLAERGGLSPAELLAVLEDRAWTPGDVVAVPRLLVLLRELDRLRRGPDGMRRPPDGGADGGAE